MINRTIKGIDINVIAAQFAELTGVKPLGDDFFTLHDCVHWFTKLGISMPEEVIVLEVQKHLQGNLKLCELRGSAQEKVENLKLDGVYEDLCLCLQEAHAKMQERFLF